LGGDGQRADLGWHYSDNHVRAYCQSPNRKPQSNAVTGEIDKAKSYRLDYPLAALSAFGRLDTSAFGYNPVDCLASDSTFNISRVLARELT
jgi:hypothetical protein